MCSIAVTALAAEGQHLRGRVKRPISLLTLAQSDYHRHARLHKCVSGVPSDVRLRANALTGGMGVRHGEKDPRRWIGREKRGVSRRDRGRLGEQVGTYALL
eukprot:GHVU01186761.1.p1 GENE.GHVU01186761.1~~GHVU01186761.1.p1  ORF type:complete len:101 (+),score=3.86 GHVU01186761.1:125-427(+)